MDDALGPAEAPDLKLRLLGGAFASADLLLEIDRAGVVTFSLGAIEVMAGPGSSGLVGKSWTDLVEDEDRELLAVMLAGAKPGERQGPQRVSLRRRNGEGFARQALLSIFSLPATPGRISCAVSLGASALEPPPLRDATGLIPAAAFADTAAALVAEAQRAGLPVRLDLVELEGLTAAVADMDRGTAEATRRKLAALLRANSYGGSGASEVTTDRFAVVRVASTSAAQLSDQLRSAAPPGVRSRTAELPLESTAPAQTLRALRHALNLYISGGGASAAEGFAASVRQTLLETQRFKTILAKGAFELAYQPVVDLQTGAIHHFEALARFDADASPADAIRLAEELELIGEFDLAVAKLGAEAISTDKSVKIAVNISAVSLLQSGFLRALTQAAKGFDGRLLFELTETHVLTDLPAAKKALQTLRGAGHPICMDDFGAGAASLDYLRQLDVDFVKIDGRYVKDITTTSRDAAIVRHVSSLCRDLGIETIAEMVETAEIAAIVKDLGVGFGQGWRFGKPAPLAAWTAPARPAKRRGTVEEWG